MGFFQLTMQAEIYTLAYLEYNTLQKVLDQQLYYPQRATLVQVIIDKQHLMVLAQCWMSLQIIVVTIEVYVETKRFLSQMQRKNEYIYAVSEVTSKRKNV